MSSEREHLRFLPIAIAALVAPAAASAHRGFGPHIHFGEGFVHPLTGLDHLLAMIAVGLFAAKLGGRALWAVPATFLALMTVGGILGMNGVPLPFVEPTIALSVLVLGLAVAIERRWSPPAAMSLVGLFAVFHGHAHGMEMPAGATGLSYGLGFIAATAMLHGLGVLIGTAPRLIHIPAPRVTRTAGAIIAVLGGGLLFGLA